MNKELAPPGRRGSVVGGLIVVAIGLWFLLGNLGVNLPNIGMLWPIFPLLGGLAFIAAYWGSDRKDAGLLLPGVGGLLIGIFFFYFTTGYFEWAEMGRLWPVFPLIGGLAFVAVWWGGGRVEHGLLVPGGVGLAVGIIGLILTLSGLSAALLANYWPVLLILVGLGILAQNLLDRDGK